MYEGENKMTNYKCPVCRKVRKLDHPTEMLICGCCQAVMEEVEDEKEIH
jgi:hypothetical protein